MRVRLEHLLFPVLVLALACGGAPSAAQPGQGNTLDQTAIEQQRAASSRGTSPPVATGGRIRCQDGSVLAEGPVGGPIENARITVRFEGDLSDETAVTDRNGEFHVCLGNRKGRPTVQLVITHSGFEPAKVDFTFEGDADKRMPLRITLRRSTK